MIPRPPFASDLTLAQELAEFEVLKPRLAEVWDSISMRDEEPHTSITREGERVRVYGDVVVVNHRLTRTTQGRSFVFRLTDVCVQRDGRWQLVNRHVTELPQPR